jgi:hypothetical protein
MADPREMAHRLMGVVTEFPGERSNADELLG